MTSKLVRDLVPQIITNAGLAPIIRFADSEEIDGLLKEKLLEEATEAAEAGSAAIAEELADVLEVVKALAGHHGITPDQLERVRAAKALERGSFARGIVWAGNHTPSATE